MRRGLERWGIPQCTLIFNNPGLNCCLCVQIDHRVGKFFSSGVSSGICTVGTEVKSTVSAAAPGCVSKEIDAGVGVHQGRNVPVVLNTSLWKLEGYELASSVGWTGGFFPPSSCQGLSVVCEYGPSGSRTEGRGEGGKGTHFVTSICEF